METIKERGGNNINRVRTRTRSSVNANGVGRTERLAQRNRVLVARWYYWTECRRLRLDDATSRLCNEFFVEERTVLNVILDGDAFFRELVEKKTSKAALKRMFGVYSWS